MLNRFFLANIFSLLLLAYCCPGLAAEERPFYMWTDEAGIINFSQTQPKDRRAEEIAQEHEFGQPPPDEDADRSSYVPPEDEANQRTRELNCMIGKKSLEKLQGFKNIFLLNDEGWWRQITEATRQAEIKKAERIIEENCPEEDFF